MAEHGEYRVPQGQNAYSTEGASFQKEPTTSAVETGPHEEQSTPTAGQDVPNPAPIRSAVPQYVRGEEHISAYVQPHAETTFVVAQADPISGRPGINVPLPPLETPETSQTQFYQQPAETVIETTEASVPLPTGPSNTIFEPPKAEWDASRCVAQRYR